MRLGKIQVKLVDWITRYGPHAFIGHSSTPPSDVGLRGYEFEEIERSLIALERRGIITKDRQFYSIKGSTP